MIKKILYIFIPIFAVLLMSHNSSAFSISQNVDVLQTVNSPQIGFFNGSTWSNYQRGYFSFNNNSGNFTYIRLTKNDFNSVNQFTKGDYIVLNGFFQSNRARILDNPELINIGGVVGPNSVFPHCSIVDFNFGAVQTYQQVSGNSGNSWYRADFQLTCKIVSVSNDLTINFRIKPDMFIVSGANTILDISFNTALLATPSSDINQEQEEATQDAANNSATSGSNSASNSQTATSSLLSVITSGIGAITSASPTNCKINGNMGNLNVGNIDLCANPVPTFMSLIGSIIAVLVVLPLVILLFNRFISIIRSFQR